MTFEAKFRYLIMPLAVEIGMPFAETTGLESLAETIEEDVYDDGYLRVEHNRYYVACGGQTLKLGRTEFLVLSRLVRSAERIVPAEEIWQYAWRNGKPLNRESLHVYIYRLRSQLQPYQLRIETMINVGYRLLVDRALQVLFLFWTFSYTILDGACSLGQTS